MHVELIDKIITEGNSESMECLRTILVDLIHKLKYTDYSEYLDVEYKLYKHVYGEHLNEKLAKKWVAAMQNKDGTYGEHWDIQQTSQYAGKYNTYDWYAVLNMMYSDYYNPKFDTATYIELAKDWLNDSDVPAGKTLHYYMYVVCQEK